MPYPSNSLQQNVKREKSLKEDGKDINVNRERSFQDIDKDIETIWKELQQLDKPIESSQNNNRWANTKRLGDFYES